MSAPEPREPLTMSEEPTLEDLSVELESARGRALLIAEQDADAPRLTDRLDAKSLAVLVAGFDALRARLADVEAERDAHGRCYSEQTMAAVVKMRDAAESRLARLRPLVRAFCLYAKTGEPVYLTEAGWHDTRMDPTDRAWALGTDDQQEADHDRR